MTMDSPAVEQLWRLMYEVEVMEEHPGMRYSDAAVLGEDKKQFSPLAHSCSNGCCSTAWAVGRAAGSCGGFWSKKMDGSEYLIQVSICEHMCILRQSIPAPTYPPTVWSRLCRKSLVMGERPEGRRY